MFVSCTVFKILSFISQNFKRSHKNKDDSLISSKLSCTSKLNSITKRSSATKKVQIIINMELTTIHTNDNFKTMTTIPNCHYIIMPQMTAVSHSVFI